jgi:hypothetical protein
MELRERHQIDDATWRKLRKMYFVLILLWTPFATAVLSFITWPIIDGLAWTLVPVIPWAVFYVVALAMYASFFTRAKSTLFIGLKAN